jgi:hypothetical protein
MVRVLLISVSDTTLSFAPEHVVTPFNALPFFLEHCAAVTALSCSLHGVPGAADALTPASFSAFLRASECLAAALAPRAPLADVVICEGTALLCLPAALRLLPTPPPALLLLLAAPFACAEVFHELPHAMREGLLTRMCQSDVIALPDPSHARQLAISLNFVGVDADALRARLLPREVQLSAFLQGPVAECWEVMATGGEALTEFPWALSNLEEHHRLESVQRTAPLRPLGLALSLQTPTHLHLPPPMPPPSLQAHHEEPPWPRGEQRRCSPTPFPSSHLHLH